MKIHDALVNVIEDQILFDHIINIIITHADWLTVWGMLSMPALSACMCMKLSLSLSHSLSLFLSLSLPPSLFISLWPLNRVRHRPLIYGCANTLHWSEREREGRREKEREKKREGEREREGGRERKRGRKERERVRKSERERKREGEREREREWEWGRERCRN